MGESMEPLQQELSADTPLGKYSYKGQHLNTIATVASLIIGFVLLYAMFQHLGDQKDANRAMKDLTSALRENNCLQRYEGRDKAERAAFCKQTSQQFVY